VKFHHRIRAAKRGIYGMGPTRITSGDLFGFYQAQADTVKRPANIVVYPNWLPLPAFELPSSRPLGDIWRRSHLVDDLTRPAGLREYRHGDAAARIDWKATARRGDVYVRTYDSSVSQRVVILLECDTSTQRWRIHPGVLDNAITAAASVAVRCIELGHGVGLVSNGNMAGSLSPPLVAPGAGPGQLTALMTTLAGANPFTTSSLEKMVAKYGAEALPHGATVVYVAGAMRPSTMAYVGDGDLPNHPGLTIQDYRGVFGAADTPDSTADHADGDDA
jgi:uncharacterized protein (DUF58 family)